MPANPEVEAYIRKRAVDRGIDPDVAVAVSRSEALNVFDPSKPDLGGDDRSSFGPYQFHYGGRSSKMPNPGLGDEFTKVTGLRADDPSTWRQQVDFALDTATKDGWRQWMGAANTGIPRWAGIKGSRALGVSAAEQAQADGPKGQEHWAQPFTPADGPKGQEAWTPPASGPANIAVAGGQTDASVSPYSLAARKGDTGLAAMGKAAMNAPGKPWQLPQIEPTPAAARIDAPTAPVLDPQAAAQRQQLVQMMLARLNQGSLV